MANSNSPPGGAAPSATSSGVIPRASANVEASIKQRKISSRRSIVLRCARNGRCGSIQIRPQPALGLFDRYLTPRCIILELVSAEARDSEILAGAIPEIEAGHGRRRQHREILGQRDLARIA